MTNKTYSYQQNLRCDNVISDCFLPAKSATMETKNNNRFHTLLLIILMCPPIISAKCDVLKEFHRQNSCFDPERSLIETEKCSERNDTILWNFTNVDSTVEIKFDLALDCEFNLYKINLKVKESVTSEEMCSKNYQFKTHTEIDYKRVIAETNTEDLKKCQKFATVKFTDIFTGCYELVVHRYYERNNTFKSIGAPMMMHKFLKSSFEKREIEKLVVNQEYRSIDSVLTLTVTHSLLKKYPYLAFTVEKHRYELAPQSKDNTKFTLCNPDQTLEAICTYNATEGKAVCDISNLESGNHSFTFELTDPIHCAQSSIWSSHVNPCAWDCNISIPPKTALSTSQESNSTSDTHTAIIAVLVVIAFVILMLSVTLLTCKIRARRSQQKKQLVCYKNTEIGLENLVKRYSILLLYPRDHQKVMDTMQALRNLLRKLGNSQVYDVYDQSCEDEISEAPETWMKEKLTDEYCKVVLILTKCGDLQIKTPLPPSKIYKEQHCFDTLFPYAARILTENEDLRLYTKLLAVNLSSDQNEYQSFKIFTPSTRFKLPDNVDNLLSELTDEPFSKNYVEMSPEFRNFSEKLKELRDFNAENPNYLLNFLNVELQKSV